MKGLGNTISNRLAIETLEIDPALSNAVFSSMPATLDKLEQTIYIYTKLCYVLSYDAQYWATENNDYVIDHFKRHIELQDIRKISPTNSEVVCVDFNLIFSKLLLDKGIKSHTLAMGRLGDDETVGMYHTDVVVPFRSLQPLSQPELSTEQNSKAMLTFAGYYDMNNIKLYGKITNVDFRGVVTSPTKIRLAIATTIDKVYNLLQKEKQNKCDTILKMQQEKLDELKNRYQSMQTQLVLAKNKEIIEDFLKQISSVHMATYPALLKASLIFKTTLGKLDSPNFVARFSILKERDLTQDDLFNMIGIIALGAPNNPTFIKFSPPTRLELIQKQDLQNRFNSGDIDYISNLMPKPHHLVPHIYSPYLEKRYVRLFRDWGNSPMSKLPLEEIKKEYQSSAALPATFELFEYYDTWHREKTPHNGLDNSQNANNFNIM